MKRKGSFIKRMLCLVLSIVLTPLFSLTVFAAEANYTDDVPYEFPVVPNTKEWESLRTRQAMLDVCQIPEDKLQSMTTGALLETVLAYPLITDYFAYNSIEDACNIMYNEFNGFQELFSRKDLSSVLTEKYDETEILSAARAETATPKEFFAASTIEYLFVCDELLNNTVPTSEFYEINAVKSAERDEMGIYSDVSNVYDFCNQNGIEAKDAGENWVPVTSGTVKTPRGNNVPEVYTRSPELTRAEKTSINQDKNAKYPLAKRVAAPTVNYNCHSYAWYMQSLSNPYWIGKYNTPSIYITDGSYRQISGTPYAGVKVWYNSADHSAVCTGTIENGSYYVTSKWGMCGGYEHLYNYGPYGGSVALYVQN